MRLRKIAILCGAVVFLYTIYLTNIFVQFSRAKKSFKHYFQKDEYFEEQINRLENEVNEIRLLIDDIPSKFLQKKLVVTEYVYEKKCSFQIDSAPATNVQMLDVYNTLNFDNLDGGAWKQGWDIKINESEWNEQNKLKVFVIPHSHNDPGWLRTFEQYFMANTRSILNNMLQKLPLDSRRKFIWAEISYFAMWWDGITDEERQKVKRLIANNQLEIVSGGWVMNDEANSHWQSILTQLTDGHEWLKTNLNYTPVSHWSIDPFGLGLTQPILLKEMGFENMLIQRVHYAIKKYLSQTNQLEFRWKQLWDGSGDTEIFTHMMPFFSYDVPHSCGPDPKVCCQFDFGRVTGCPWGVPSVDITDKNVAEKATLLLDQYRKKSKLYKSNIILVPLGDDFRYDKATEWDVQYNNHQKLFDYMNSHPNLHVEAQFGTLTDYFNEVRRVNSNKMSTFPTLSGDFFTYADHDDHYWSGYYTSRPYYKRMDRILLSYIKAAESIHALAYLSNKPGSSWIVDREVGIEKILTSARHSLSLFQHHDGITGTAKDYVVKDYEKKMLSAIFGCQQVIQLCTSVLLNCFNDNKPDKNAVYYNIHDIIHPEKQSNEIVLNNAESKKIVFYNSLTFSRQEVVTFNISTPFVEVLDFQKSKVICQISPVIDYNLKIPKNKYLLSFVANIPPLSLVEYTINGVSEINVPSDTVRSKISILNNDGEVQVPIVFHSEIYSDSSEFTLQNDRVTAYFNKMGLLTTLKTASTVIPTQLDFAKYGVQETKEPKSGAYLFLPGGHAVPIESKNVAVVIIKGPIFSSVFVQLPYVQHSVTLYNNSGADSLGIEIQNLVDIANTDNFELVMRLSTTINNTDEFFTDSNGYQVVRRKRFKKLPLQANYYPMPTMAYIEDNNARLTISTSSPLGCSSLSPGRIEVMLDRRLNQDDHRGLAQGVLDNRPIKHIFRVHLESRQSNCQSTTKDHPAGFPTVSSYVASQALLNPMIKLVKSNDENDGSNSIYISIKEFGVDFSMPLLKTNIQIKDSSYVGLVIYRQFLDTCFADRFLLEEFPLSQGSINFNRLIPLNRHKNLQKASLSFLFLKDAVDVKEQLSVCPMKMQAFVF